MTAGGRVPDDLDGLIEELHELLAPAEAELEAVESHCRYPVVLVVGAPRGGTTLLYSWLAASGAFAYPTNLMARLSRVPAISARLQKLYTDPAYRFGDELFDLTGHVGYESDLGKTAGALAPNEVWFLWRRFLPTTEIQALGPDGVAATDVDGLRAALASIETVFDKPLAMKGMMLQYDLARFAELLPEAFFLHIERDTVANAQSLLLAREQRTGSRNDWYSAKPANWEDIAQLPPTAQVVEQVRQTHRAIRDGLDHVDASRWLRWSYEDFCGAPANHWEELHAALGGLGGDIPAEYRGPTEFEVRNEDRLDPADVATIRALVAE